MNRTAAAFILAASMTASSAADAQTRYYSRAKLQLPSSSANAPTKPAVPTASCAGKGVTNLYVSDNGQSFGGDFATKAEAVKSCEAVALSVFNQVYDMKASYDFACNISAISPTRHQLTYTTAPKGQVRMVTDSRYDVTEGYWCTYSR